jgi:hypothetical protein
MKYAIQAGQCLNTATIPQIRVFSLVFIWFSSSDRIEATELDHVSIAACSVRVVLWLKAPVQQRLYILRLFAPARRT